MNHSPPGPVVRRAMVRTVALACAAALLLTSCTGARDDPEDVVPPSGSPAASPTPTASPLREARTGWKVFTDPGRLLSFELPDTWRVQTAQPEPGRSSPGSLHYAVLTAEGVVAAELHTGVVIPETPCEDWERTPYYVIGSEALEGAGSAPGPDRVEPHFVIRLITGFRFFGSYGITDRVGSDDGLACALPNTVEAGERLGRVSFGDLPVLVPKTPADTGPATGALGPPGEAGEYHATTDFDVVGQVIRSLRFEEGAREPG